MLLGKARFEHHATVRRKATTTKIRAK